MKRAGTRNIFFPWPYELREIETKLSSLFKTFKYLKIFQLYLFGS